MKLILIILLTIVIIPKVYSQDLLKEIQKLTLANDSLQRQVINSLNDRISNLTSQHQLMIIGYGEKIKVLESDLKKINKNNNDLIEQLNEIKKDKAKIEKDKLKAKFDSLTFEFTKYTIKNDSVKKLFQKERALNSKNLVELKEYNDRNVLQEKEKARIEIFDKIIQSYGLPFNELVKIKSLSLIFQDINIIGNKTAIQPKLEQLLVYYNAEQALQIKFNAENISLSIAAIAKLEQTELVLLLKNKLGNYNLRNEGLKKTISKINDIDKSNIAKDEEVNKLKFQDILAELAWYYRNYEFNFLDYPFLAEIIQDINKIKQKDSNGDISKLLDKL